MYCTSAFIRLAHPCYTPDANGTLVQICRMSYRLQESLMVLSKCCFKDMQILNYVQYSIAISICVIDFGYVPVL